MKKQIQLSIAALALCGTALLPGCIVAAAAVGAAGVAYVSGDLEARLEHSPQQVVDAAKNAFSDLEIRVVSAEASAIDGKVVGRTALERRVDLTVHRDGETASKLAIRIDTFGDEELSRQILTKIEEKL